MVKITGGPVESKDTQGLSGEVQVRGSAPVGSKNDDVGAFVSGFAGMAEKGLHVVPKDWAAHIMLDFIFAIEALATKAAFSHLLKATLCAPTIPSQAPHCSANARAA